MLKLRVLLADDMFHERLVIAERLKETLKDNIELNLVAVETAEEAVEHAKRSEFDLVILDIDFSKSPKSKGMDGLTASRKIKAMKPDLYTVVVSSNEEEETMRAAVEEFSVDWYLRRSSISYEELGWLAKQALVSRLHREGMLLEDKYRYLTENAGAKTMLRQADAVTSFQSVLLFGETGTGKELIARRIHANAKAFNPKRPLKILDCTAIAPNLFESALFGHKKGSYTGATEDRVGILELANGGDLFLDEIHNIPLDIQAKLLRPLNDGVFTPLGSNIEIKSKFRVIAATNIPLEEAVASGKLRQDIVERIRQIKIDLPALRERPEDVPVIIEKHLSSHGAVDKEFSSDAVEYMQGLPWKGNIRELKSLITMAVGQVKIPIISKSHIETILAIPTNNSSTTIKAANVSNDPLDLAVDRLVASGIPLEDGLNRLKLSYFLKALERYSLAELAKANGYSRTKLYRTLKELGIEGRNN